MRMLLFLSVVMITGSPALAQRATVSEQDCRQLVEHVASPDVNYKPGVDVRGRPVAPADLNTQPQIGVPQSFTFDLNVSLQGFGIPSSSRIFQPSANVGKITVEDGGRRVLFNGQPLGDTEQRAIAELCKQRQSQQQTRPMTAPIKLK